MSGSDDTQILGEDDACFTDIDQEVERVRVLLRDTALLHTCTLETFKAVAGDEEYFQREEQLKEAFNALCVKVHAPTFALDDQDIEDLFDSRMNFSAFFQLSRDYLAAVTRAVSSDLIDDQAIAD
jgi:hypothetical protein